VNVSEEEQIESVKWAVVIPSIRGVDPALLQAIPEHIPVYVVDDSDGNVVANRPHMRVFYYADQSRMLGSKATLVPRKTAACRNFAYYYIWKETDHTHIITLDDDCKTHSGFLTEHGVVGTVQEWETYTSPTGWLNSIDLLPVPQSLFARGYPYWIRGESPDYQVSRTMARSVCNLGLWTHHLDFDGIDKYVVDRYQQMYDFNPAEVRCIRAGTPATPSFVPFSGMNVGFIRAVLPIMTQIPMNQQLGLDYSIWRFDDLWSGVLIQSLIDKNPVDCLTVGTPIVTHLRVGNIKREVNGEHYGHLLSPYFHEVVQEASQRVHNTGYGEMYVELCAISHELALRKGEARKIPKLYANTLSGIFDHLAEWGRLFL
jgi:reversibly glycosylated polypeptide